MKNRIPFNKPFIIGKELVYIKDAVKRGHISGDGYYTKKCQELLEKKFHIPKVLLTTSCTSALEMTAILCDIKPGDEVIVSSFTFTSTALAFYRLGAKLKFVDIDQQTLNIDPRHIEKAVSKKTKVIALTHYAGVSCDMDAILDIAKRNNLFVVEDAAQGVNALYKGKYLGSLGTFGTFSFHETKNCISGEGGALLINDESFVERAEIIREKGTNRNKFLKGQVDKYTWVDTGSSYLPSDLIAAFLYAQLQNMDKIHRKRKRIYEYYYKKLKKLEDKGFLRLPIVPKDIKTSYHIFYILLENETVRQNVIAYLKSKNISAVFHYVPLHSSPMGLAMGYAKGDLPVTEDISSRLLRLPFFYSLTQKEQARVVGDICRFFGER
ncbi:MAG: dTDP-4-amino-4,6-dideoxygalactose transaminase [bacterium]|nr:dTDP-4-amino-4,6-dideoxygalactose transaminase [bacterium]